jgi:hypothetical protein
MRVRLLMLLCVALARPCIAQAQTTGTFGTVTITVRPPDAQVFIDGERWLSPEATGPLAIRLVPGRHTVEIRSAGHLPFSAEVDVRRGQSTPLNVVLPEGEPEPAVVSPIREVSRAPEEDGFVVAPDFKVTAIDRRTTGLAGVYGGAVFAGRFLLGAGAYVQFDDRASEQMVYGGLVSEWRFFHARPVGLALHGLAGWGQTSLYYDPLRDRRPYDPRRGSYYYGYAGDEHFFIAEPEARIVARFGRSLRLVGGVGYRFTSAETADLNGVTGSISIQFGK